MNVILAPDVYINASVALGSAPDQVVQRVLGKHKGESKTTEWILGRIRGMLSALPAFKKEAVDAQIDLIRGFVQVVEDPSKHGPDAWVPALVAAARAAGVKRVITDHPDIADKTEVDGVEFLSSEAWLLELTMPPPPP